MSLDRNTQDWLRYRGSMTARMRKVCKHNLKIEIQKQTWEVPCHHEMKALGMKRHVRVWIREIKMICDNEDWIWARTLIPKNSLVGRNSRLRHLNLGFLGDFLFKDPLLKRTPFEIALIRSNHRNEKTNLLARRSNFELNGKKLLVCEVFLPGMMQRILNENLLLFSL